MTGHCLVNFLPEVELIGCLNLKPLSSGGGEEGSLEVEPKMFGVDEVGCMQFAVCEVMKPAHPPPQSELESLYALLQGSEQAPYESTRQSRRRHVR